MTDQFKNKNYIAFSIFAALALIALIYGFSLITSPFELQKIKYDQTRVSDLHKLTTQIAVFYNKYNRLPQSLTELTDAPMRDGDYDDYNYNSLKTSKNDPQTNKQYEYIQTGKNSYMLCAAFNTDTLSHNRNTKPQSYLDEDYKYREIKNSYAHATGRYCFNKTVDPSDDYGSYKNYNRYPTPTAVKRQEDKGSGYDNYAAPTSKLLCAGADCPDELTPAHGLNKNESTPTPLPQ